MRRQKVRRLLLIASLLLFPVTLYYFSPALILTAAAEGIINGSFIVFGMMFIGSMFFGRIFCGYLCPAAGLQEMVGEVYGKSPKQGWRNGIKYGIWLLWLGTVVFCYASKGGIVQVDFFFETQYGISVTNLYALIIYYGIILLILIPALWAGKRAFCHYFCWMAPFMVLGDKLGRFLHLPGIKIETKPERCISCEKCNKACPMQINPQDLSKPGKVIHSECISCHACADSCPKKVFQVKIGKRA
jgi:polyferredoxin